MPSPAVPGEDKARRTWCDGERRSQGLGTKGPRAPSSPPSYPEHTGVGGSRPSWSAALRGFGPPSAPPAVHRERRPRGHAEPEFTFHSVSLTWLNMKGRLWKKNFAAFP